MSEFLTKMKRKGGGAEKVVSEGGVGGVKVGSVALRLRRRCCSYFLIQPALRLSARLLYPVPAARPVTRPCLAFTFLCALRVHAARAHGSTVVTQYLVT